MDFFSSLLEMTSEVRYHRVESMEIFKDFQFEAAHCLPRAPEGHKCRRLHGHSYRVRVHVQGSVATETGWVMDFADIGAAFHAIHVCLDHRYLNEIPGLDNPTCEAIATWIWDRLKPTLPSLTRITIHETCTAGCSY